MTNEEAIEHGKEDLEVFGGTHAEFIELSLKAIEKQIPMKPYTKNGVYGLVWYCNNCGYSLCDYDDSLYCSFCGQRVDWSDKK